MPAYEYPEPEELVTQRGAVPTNTVWEAIGAASIPGAPPPEINGLATQAEAVAGQVNNKWMSPLRVRQAVIPFASSWFKPIAFISASASTTEVDLRTISFDTSSIFKAIVLEVASGPASSPLTVIVSDTSTTDLYNMVPIIEKDLLQKIDVMCKMSTTGFPAPTGHFFRELRFVARVPSPAPITDSILHIIRSFTVPGVTAAPLYKKARFRRSADGGMVYASEYSQVYVIACSDELSPLSAGVKVVFRAPEALTLTNVRASLTIAPTTQPLIVDVKQNGTSLLSTKLSIDASEKTSVTAAAPVVFSATNIFRDAEISIHIDQASGSGLKVTLEGEIV